MAARARLLAPAAARSTIERSRASRARRCGADVSLDGVVRAAGATRLLFQTKHGIVDQSLRARMGAEPTNGDGFGLGWYGDDGEPALYRSESPGVVGREPARACRAATSHAFLVHVRRDRLARAADQLPPVPPGRWLFVHNGFVADFPLLRRDLMLALAPDRFAAVQGSTAPRCSSSSPSPTGSRTIRSRRWRGRSASSTEPPGDAGAAAWCKRASASATAPAVGGPPTRPRARRAPCSPPPTSTPCAASTPTTAGSRAFSPATA